MAATKEDLLGKPYSFATAEPFGLSNRKATALLGYKAALASDAAAAADGDGIFTAAVWNKKVLDLYSPTRLSDADESCMFARLWGGRSPVQGRRVTFAPGAKEQWDNNFARLELEASVLRQAYSDLLPDAVCATRLVSWVDAVGVANAASGVRLPGDVFADGAIARDDFRAPEGSEPSVFIGWVESDKAVAEGPLQFPPGTQHPACIAVSGGAGALTAVRVSQATPDTDEAWMRAPLIAGIGAAQLVSGNPASAFTKGSVVLLVASATPKAGDVVAESLDDVVLAAGGRRIVAHAVAQAAALPAPNLKEHRVRGVASPEVTGGASLFSDWAEQAARGRANREAAVAAVTREVPPGAMPPPPRPPPPAAGTSFVT
eukprot:gene34711-48859_t